MCNEYGVMVIVYFTLTYSSAQYKKQTHPCICQISSNYIITPSEHVFGFPRIFFSRENHFRTGHVSHKFLLSRHWGYIFQLLLVFVFFCLYSFFSFHFSRLFSSFFPREIIYFYADNISHVTIHYLRCVLWLTVIVFSPRDPFLFMMNRHFLYFYHHHPCQNLYCHCF